jgi:hypothetical protein
MPGSASIPAPAPRRDNAAVKQALENQLWQAAEATAEEAAFGIGPECAEELRRFIGEGTRRMEAEGKLADADALQDAKTNLGRFVKDMAGEAGARGLDMLRESTFFAIKDRLCPLWPFC